jgi:signal transduction histidine kinase
MGEPPGGLPRIMAVIRDRTESHRAASALRSADAASRAKTEFLATVSHELREPLNGVLGMFQLLARTPLDRDQVMMLELLQSSGHSLLGVVEDLLDFSRIEAGTLHLDPQPTSMARLVETVASVYHAPGAARGVRILHSCDPRVSPALLADAVRMRQVVSSLVANALECAREGPVEIAVELLQRVEGDDVIRIVVADAGAGLPANDRARHFEPLAGGPETLPGRAALGLAICRRLVLLMGGALDVSTREGGIRVALTFRLRITEPTVQTASVHALERPVRQVTGPG